MEANTGVFPMKMIPPKSMTCRDGHGCATFRIDVNQNVLQTFRQVIAGKVGPHQNDLPPFLRVRNRGYVVPVEAV